MKYPNNFGKVSRKASLVALPILAALFLLAVLPGGARADTLTTYDVNGVFQSGGTFTGSFSIDYDGSNPVVYDANFVADGNNIVCTAGSPCPVFMTQDLSSNPINAIDIPTGTYPFLLLGWAPIDFSAPPNVLDLSTTSFCQGCDGYNGDIDYLVSGTAIDPPQNEVALTQTPEPPAVMLFGMGLIGIGALVTRGKSAKQNS